MTAKVDVKRTISEAAWQSRVIDYARLMRWLVVHVRASKTARGWAVPYEGDPGLPDLILARDGTTLLIELKSQGGRLTPMQTLWIKASGGYCFKPSDWPRVQELLR